MKKTFFILSALVAITAVSQAASIFTTSHNSSLLDRGNYRGIRLQLDDTSWLATTSSEEDTALPTTVFVTNLSIMKRDVPGLSADFLDGEIYGSYIDGAFKMALVDASGTLLAFSDNSLMYADIEYSGAMDFTFSSAPAVATNAIINFYYVKAEATEADFMSNNVMIGSSVAYNFDAPDNQGMIGTARRDLDNTWGAIFSVTTTDTLPVPEPATATLGLLGLAGLAVRRRR